VARAAHGVGALIFDFDGLMIDTERVEADCIIEALADWGVEVTYADFGHLFGSVDADEEWGRLLDSWCGRSPAELDARLREIATPLKDALPLLPGVRELLDAADDYGIPTAIATGNTVPTLQRRLGRHGVFDRFHTIVTRADVTRGKPAPDIYLEAARRLGVPADACLALEDSVLGCEAALAAGMQVVACPSVVTAHCEYPARARRVTSLVDVTL
jgi:HAD superfamily hydrolase (TIGR01509 family)